MKRMSSSIGPCALRIVVLAFVLAATSATAVAQQLIDTIPVGTTPYGVAVNPVTNQIYVAKFDGNSVTVIDGTTFATATVSAGSGRESLAVNPVTNQIYVANGASNNVTVIDGTNNSVVKTVTVGTFPYFLAANPVTNQIYVANLDSKNVTVIDGTNNSVIKTVTVGTSPCCIAVNPVTNQIYVVNAADDTVTVIDGTNNSVIKTVTVENTPYDIVVNPVTNQIYVANLDSKNVTVIDGTSNSVIKTVNVGTYPLALAINAVTNQTYVANSGSDNVSVIDGTTNSVIKTVSVGHSPYSIAVNPVTNQIYVPNLGSDSVTVIDGTNNSVVKTVSVGSSPQSLAINPVTNKVYVSNIDDNTVSVIAGADATALQLVAVTPCRLVDTRNSKTPIQGGTSQAFPVPQLGGCKIPATAAAYSLNITVVPHGPLGYLTVWPTGEDQPLVSTMNSDGRVKANAAIVAAGYQGAVSVYASNTTDAILDINGYFAPVSGSTLAFYPLTPCRVADTRKPNGSLGGPYLKAKQERDFPVPQSPCNIPSAAQAYSLNFTALPRKAGGLGYLTVWPLGQSQPLVSTLNAPTGAVTANAAIVPAGYIGNISTYASDDTDLVIDVNGYFAPAGDGGLSLYPSAPCRVLDTRQSGGLFSGTIGSNVVESVCGPPQAAQAYVLNATVIPHGSLGYLTLWPNGESQPVVSTLNAIDGAITSNMAIVPTANGSIDAYASNLTQLIVDISSYFAP